MSVAVFWVLFVTVVASALIATYSRNIVTSAYALFFTLLGLAGVYVLLRADFLAVTQVVIYVGGILVLLLFGVLLTNRNLENLVVGSGRRSYVIASIGGLALLLVLFALINLAHWKQVPLPQIPGTTTPIGRLLLTDYLLPFEFSSITLLASLVGAAYLVRTRERD